MRVAEEWQHDEFCFLGFIVPFISEDTQYETKGSPIHRKLVLFSVMNKFCDLLQRSSGVATQQERKMKVKRVTLQMRPHRASANQRSCRWLVTQTCYPAGFTSNACLRKFRPIVKFNRLRHLRQHSFCVMLRFCLVLPMFAFLLFSFLHQTYVMSATSFCSACVTS